MKIRLLTNFGGADRNYAPGEEADFSADDAKALIESGQAVPVGKAPAKRAETRKK
jgi:hypothetical protein